MNSKVRIFALNGIILMLMLSIFEIGSFLVLNIERKSRKITNNNYEKDEFVKYKNTNEGFYSNGNSYNWNLYDQNRILIRSSCTTKKSDNKNTLNLLISGGSTSDPLGTQHSGLEGTWIDHLVKNFQNSNKCINIFSVAMAGYESDAESRAVRYALKKLKNKKNLIVISYSGINEIYKNESTNINRSQTIIFLEKFQTYWLIKKISNVFNMFNNGRQLENFDKFQEKLSESYLSEAEAESNSFQWYKTHLKLEETLNQSNAVYLLFLQPTLGLDHDPYIIREDIKTISNPIKKTLISDIFDDGYFLAINYLYASLRKYCAKMSFCINKSQEILLTTDISLYSDYRHPNSEGNKLIADFIFKKINLVEFK